ncbi:hypothetical protein [Gaoshiqia sp. Z1-71]|uniref:hypothetical protein n=1 Tax=Gaoshiqia hydrogeniformans TaxID=3290090 RepID=UPI003BF87E0F
MKNIFEHELSISSLPFKDIFEKEPFREYLFEQFCGSPTKPCLWLYREQFFSQEEYEKIIARRKSDVYPTDDEIELRNIYGEFEKKQFDNTLDEQFFCPDILRTPISIALLEINKALGFFKESDFKNEGELSFYVDIITKALTSLSSPDFKNEIIKKIVEDDINFHALGFDNGESLSKWAKAKFKLNHLLSGQIKHQDAIDQSPLNYEKLFKDPKECARLTNIIINEGCKDGVFCGFKDVPGNRRAQLIEAYDIIKEQFLKPIYAGTKGTVEEAKKLFFMRFGWIGYRGTKPEGENLINLKKSTPAQSQSMRKDIELILK